MLTAIVFLLVTTIVLFVIAYRRKDNSHIQALKSGKTMFVSLIPVLLLAFLVAGLIQVAIPKGLIHSWLGSEAGWKGIVIGSITGVLIPGGPYMAFPIIGAIFKAGAGIGTGVALITGWGLLGVGLIPFELAMIGPRFMMVRLFCVFLFPLIAGFLAQAIF